MTASSGTVPQLGDTIRVDSRATDDVPPGARLRVLATRDSTIAGWRYLEVLVLTDDGEPGHITSVFVPMASVTILDGTDP